LETFFLFHSNLTEFESLTRRFITKISNAVISNKEFQKLIYMMQRYKGAISKFTEIAVDLLSKIIKYSSALKEAGEKTPA